MPIKCYNKPNRRNKRVFSARDCGRIVCYAIEDGANRNEVFKEVSKCLGDPCQYERIEQLIKLILEAMAAIAIALTIARGLLVALRVFRVLLLRIPGIRALLPGMDATILRLEDSFAKATDITKNAELISKIVNKQP